MPSRVFEDTLVLDIDVLEAVPLSPTSSAEELKSYPYPFLRPTGKRQTLAAKVVVIENSALRIAVAPELGGRIVDILDKRVSTAPVQSLKLQVQAGGPRGANLPFGISWSSAPERLNELGPVEYQLVEPDDDGSPAGVLLFELGVGVSVHVGISLPPDRAEILLEMRSFNRTFDWKPYAPRVTLDLESVSAVGSSSRFAPDVMEQLSPRQLDRWSATLIPHAGLGGLTALSPDLALYLEGGELRLQATAPLMGCKVVLLTADGQTLESSADLYPERITQMDAKELPAIQGVVVLDSAKNELLRWPAPECAPISMEGSSPQNTYRASALRQGIVTLRHGHNAEPYLEEACFELGLKAASFSALGIYDLRRQRFQEAESHFENALLYNAEDHLTWWMKSVAQRHQAGPSQEPSPDLLNAHFLAPLDPVLRAESLLGSKVGEGKGPNPLLQPLADNPDAFIEVGCLLHDAGLYSDLHRWADETLRYREIPMLRYLLADALLVGSRMRTEAAQQVQAAAKAPVNPPYPYRETERLALERLSEVFPEDARIQELLSFLIVGSN